MGAKYEVQEIPADLQAKAEEYRATLVETVAEASEELMEKYLEGEEISVDELKAGIRKMTINSELYPVFVAPPSRTAASSRCLTPSSTSCRTRSTSRR